MVSIWKSVELKKFESLKENRKVNTVIIGGGMAGLLIADALTEKGIDNILIEANRICSGQTKNTTAKITGQHGVIYSKIEKYYGAEFAKQYAVENDRAIKEYQRIITEREIDCDFERTEAVLYSIESNGQLQKEFQAAKQAGIDCYLMKGSTLPFDVKEQLVFRNQAQFHPLKFVSGILDGLRIFENTRAEKMIGNTVYTKNAEIEAKNIVIATHYPFVNFPGEMFLKMSQERSYSIAFRHQGFPSEGMYIGTGEDTLSFRRYKEYVILGGGSHRTGTASPSDEFARLRKTAETLFKTSDIAYEWSAQDCITLDGLPYIGRLSPKNHHIYVASGFNKWGMTSSMVSAHILSELIGGGQENGFDVFSPRRCHLGAECKNISENTWETVKGFAAHLKMSFSNAETLQKGEGKEISYQGKTVGAFRDDDGHIYVVSLTCPHLKCKLKWNPFTKTWDCPCHGSRYDFKGNLLDNPAQQGSILIDIL